MTTVLVTDGEQRAALATVRSLARAGRAVYVVSSRRHSLAGASRYSRAEATVPDPLHHPDDFVSALEALAGRWLPEVLLPVSEASLLALLPERARFRGVRIPFPAADVFERVRDKALVLRTARALGIGVPANLELATRADAGALTPDELRFPLVVKPARSVVVVGGARRKTEVAHAADWPALRAVLDSLPATAYPLLLQERIVGPGVGIFVLLWRGELLASAAHRRLREKPPSGGVSVYRESVAVDPALLELSRALLRELGWDGVAMVEYKLDLATGVPYLMEINGRLWGSLQLAIDAGVDFPGLLVSAARGEPLRPSRCRAGVRSRWLLGDLDHLLLRLRHSRESLSLDATASGRVRALLDFLAAFRDGGRGEVFRLDDPAPAWREAMDWVRGR